MDGINSRKMNRSNTFISLLLFVMGSVLVLFTKVELMPFARELVIFSFETTTTIEINNNIPSENIQLDNVTYNNAFAAPKQVQQQQVQQQNDTHQWKTEQDQQNPQQHHQMTPQTQDSTGRPTAANATTKMNSTASSTTAAPPTLPKTIPLHVTPQIHDSTRSPTAADATTKMNSTASSTTGATTALPETKTKKKKAAIAALTTNRDSELEELCIGLRSLNNLADMPVDLNNATQLAEAADEMADVLVFHENNVNEKQQAFVQSCTRRKVYFPPLGYDFQTFFPEGFDPIKETPNWKKRNKWGYHQMIRFWITHVWRHPALKPYETLMRLDTDACWMIDLHDPKIGTYGYSHLPGLPPPSSPDNDNNNDNGITTSTATSYVYHANRRYFEAAIVSTNFDEFCASYVQKHNITIQNMELYKLISTRDKNNQSTAPLFFNNFEVVNIEFMQRPEIQQFHEALTEHEPFGVFRYRWGDAVERYATMAIFVPPTQIFGQKNPPGYRHGHCGDAWKDNPRANITLLPLSQERENVTTTTTKTT